MKNKLDIDSRLLPCPFCGAYIVSYLEQINYKTVKSNEIKMIYFRVECSNNCFTSNLCSNNVEEIINLINRRVGE